MKKTLLILASLAFSFTSYAQLEVTSDGKVIIASNQSTSYAKLLAYSSFCRIFLSGRCSIAQIAG